jgi:hypothetical protein
VDPALDDPEDGLSGRPLLLVPGEAAVEPPVGALGRPGGVVAVGVEGGALVEGEGDVRAERRLDRHRLLRAEKPVRAVEQGLERDPPLGDLDLRTAGDLAPAPLDLVRDPAVGEREDLEAAGVGDQRPLPVHEAVESAAAGDQLLAGRQVEVEGVAEDQLVAERGDLGGGEAPHAALGGERDERRGADLAVGGMQEARAGGAVTGLDLESEPRRVGSHPASLG